MYDQNHPFYLDPYPESQDQENKDLQKDFEESTAQAVHNAILLIVAFILIGVACVVVHFARSF